MPARRAAYRLLLAAWSLLTLVGRSPLAAAPLHARSFTIARATSPIKIDGQLDEPAWRDALHYDIPYEWSPGDNVPALVHTDFYATYDERNLYVAWRAADPNPAEIRAHLMDRDAIDTLVQDDHVVLLIDSFNDERRAVQIRINPLGVQADALNSENEGIEDWSYDFLWSSAGRITADGYVVEVAIPFSQLRFPAGSEPQTWGFDVGRSYPRSVRHRLLAWPRDRDRGCGLCQIDKVSGFVGMKPGLNLELDPTLTALRAERREPFPDGTLRKDREDTDVGLSARWGLTTNLTLSAALNPDFSQVEADAAQLDVNQRFALFFPEKRPFFLEGTDFLSTPIQAVFTRTVIDPDWGLKLTGKVGANGLGVVVTRDTANGFLVPANQSSSAVFLPGELVTGSVLRYRRDVGRGSSIGALFTGREGDAYHNRVGGADLFWRFDDSNTLAVQALHSETLYPGEVAERYGQASDAFGGEALQVQYNYTDRLWVANASYDDRSAGFRADSGFVPRVDMRKLAGWLGRNVWREGKAVHRFTLVAGAEGVENHGGTRTDDLLWAATEIFGPQQLFIRLEVDRASQRFHGRLFEDLLSLQTYAEIQPNGGLKLTLTANGGDAVDFANVQAARYLRLVPTAELKLGRHWNAQLSHTHERLTVDGGELFTAELSQLRLVYNFNTRTFARVIAQYFSIDRDPALYGFPVGRHDEELFTQWLFSYKLNPQTVFFAGYADNSAGNESIDLTRSDRTFFLKVGYAWVQ